MTSAEARVAHEVTIASFAAVISDLDGVLVDSTTALQRVWSARGSRSDWTAQH